MSLLIINVYQIYDIYESVCIFIPLVDKSVHFCTGVVSGDASDAAKKAQDCSSADLAGNAAVAVMFRVSSYVLEVAFFLLINCTFVFMQL